MSEEDANNQQDFDGGGSGSEDEWDSTMGGEEPNPLPLRTDFTALRAPTLLAQLEVTTDFKVSLVKDLSVYVHTLLFSEYLPFLLGLAAAQQLQHRSELVSPTADILSPAMIVTSLDELAALFPQVVGDASTKAEPVASYSLTTDAVVAMLKDGRTTPAAISDRLTDLELEVTQAIALLHEYTRNRNISSSLLSNYLYPFLLPLISCPELLGRSAFHYEGVVKAFARFHRLRTRRAFPPSASLPVEPLLAAFSYALENESGSGSAVAQAAMVASYHFKEADGSGNMLRRHWSYFAPLIVHEPHPTEHIAAAFLSFLPKFECVRTEQQREVALSILDELLDMAATPAATGATHVAAAVLPRFVTLLLGGSLTHKGSKNPIDRNHAVSLYRANAGLLNLSAYSERFFTLATRTVGIKSQYVTAASTGAAKPATGGGSVSKSQAVDWGRAIAHLLTPDPSTSAWAHLRRFARVGETFMGVHS